MKRLFAVFTLAIMLVVSSVTVSSAGPKKISKCKTIKKSGSYVVSKNLQATAKRDGNCIIIEADYVSIDLNGFTLIGLGDNTGTGIWDNAPGHGMGPQGIVVRNGMVTGFANGVDLYDSEIITIDNVIAIYNQSRGIAVGEGSTIVRCKTQAVSLKCPSSLSYSMYWSRSIITYFPNGPCDTATGNIEFPQ